MFVLLIAVTWLGYRFLPEEWHFVRFEETVCNWISLGLYTWAWFLNIYQGILNFDHDYIQVETYMASSWLCIPPDHARCQAEWEKMFLLKPFLNNKIKLEIIHTNFDVDDDLVFRLVWSFSIFFGKKSGSGFKKKKFFWFKKI